MDRLTELVPSLTWSEHLVTTEGDLSNAPLSTLNTPGIFVSALRDELLRESVDLVVHSMKDLPAKPHPSIELAAVPVREDPRDVLVCPRAETLLALPLGSRVGTSSPRREASVRRVRPDFIIEPIRGSITTRIEKVMRGDFDATILAKAGLIRAGLTDSIRQEFDMTAFLPAPRQGALAIECRAGDEETSALARLIDDLPGRVTAFAEQGVLIGLDAGCHVAVGAHARWEGDVLELHAELAVAETGEAELVSGQVTLTDSPLDQAQSLGLALAERLLAFPMSQRALAQ